jgi:hypothetical protein
LAADALVVAVEPLLVVAVLDVDELLEVALAGRLEREASVV